KLIKAVTEDIENFRFNTAVSSFMKFINEVKDELISRDTFVEFLKVLYPFAPHISEELFAELGGKKSLQIQAWPKYNPKKVAAATVEVVVQVNGKVRDKLAVDANTSEEELKAQALA